MNVTHLTTMSGILALLAVPAVAAGNNMSNSDGSLSSTYGSTSNQPGPGSTGGLSSGSTNNAMNSNNTMNQGNNQSQQQSGQPYGQGQNSYQPQQGRQNFNQNQQRPGTMQPSSGPQQQGAAAGGNNATMYYATTYYQPTGTANRNIGGDTISYPTNADPNSMVNDNQARAYDIGRLDPSINRNDRTAYGAGPSDGVMDLKKGWLWWVP